MYAIQFGALADETRCRLLEMLAQSPLPVHTLAAEFSISRPAISRHLRVLKEAGLVSEEKQGRENVYRLVSEPLEPLRSWLVRFAAKPARAPRKKGDGMMAATPIIAPMAAPAAPAKAIEPANDASPAPSEPKASTKKPRARKPAVVPESEPQVQMAWEF